MYELDRPAYLQLLLLVPLLWVLFAYLVRYRRKKQDALATPHVLLALAPYKSTTALVWKTLLYSLVIVSISSAGRMSRIIMVLSRSCSSSVSSPHFLAKKPNAIRIRNP